MKKIILITVLAALLSSQVYAKEKDAGELICGLIFTAAGALIAYNGFQPVDSSYPAVDILSFSTNTAGSGPWDISGSGTVKNAGNVQLRNVNLIITYRDSLGAAAGTQTVSLDNKSAVFNIDDTDSFSTSLTGLTLEPSSHLISVDADYTAIYEAHSLGTGIYGAAVLAIGLFYVADYIFEFTDYLAEKNIGLRLAAAPDGINITASKNF